jgi:hypothetical protein
MFLRKMETLARVHMPHRGRLADVRLVGSSSRALKPAIA